MQQGLFAGSFDPPTWGHLDIITRAKSLCKLLYVGVAQNSEKQAPLLTIQERIDLLRELCHTMPSVKVVMIPALVGDFVKANKIELLFRALRTQEDFEKERATAITNRHMVGVETFMLFSDVRHQHISSTLVKEIARFGAPLEEFVPPLVAHQIIKKLTK